MKRLLIATGVAFLALALPTLAGASSPGLTLTSTQATYVIPSGEATWTLTLWSAGKDLGRQTGSEGTLTVVVPAGTDCSFQADVQRNGKRVAGTRHTFATCGPEPTTTTTTTTAPPQPVTPNATTGAPASGGSPTMGSLPPQTEKVVPAVGPGPVFTPAAPKTVSFTG
jgi:hypothetical protein